MDRKKLKQMLEECFLDDPARDPAYHRDMMGALRHSSGREARKKRIRDIINGGTFSDEGPFSDFYSSSDAEMFGDFDPGYAASCLRPTLEDLIARDKQRKEDGFFPKIRMGNISVRTRTGKKVIPVPVTEEEKLYHSNKANQEDSQGGTGEEQEGEVIGKEDPDADEPAERGAGDGPGENHEIESNAYEIGRVLTEQLELPDMEDKKQIRSRTRFTYDLDSTNRKHGQILDQERTMRNIIQTNIALGNINVDDIQAGGTIDPTKLVINPDDKIYRIMSRKRDMESLALVFFMRDYSGSMSGPPAKAVVDQHVYLYSWLMFQYDKRVVTRFLVHDTEAKELPTFYDYYNAQVGGGTRVAPIFELANRIVRDEGLERDYNIYAFYGLDGDDGSDPSDTIEGMKTMLRYVKRLGMTVVKEDWYANSGYDPPDGYDPMADRTVEIYMKESGILDEHKANLRMNQFDITTDDTYNDRLIQSIRELLL